MNNQVNSQPWDDFPVSPMVSDAIEDTVGHAFRRGHDATGSEATIASADEDVQDAEGHVYRRGQGATGGDATNDSIQIGAEEDTEGHAFRR